MPTLERRSFLKLLAATGLASTLEGSTLRGATQGKTHAGSGGPPSRIVNEYSALLPGEKAGLASPPAIDATFAGGVRLHGGKAGSRLDIGSAIDGWHLLAVFDLNGVATAVFEKHVTHRGALAFVTADRGTVALIPKGVGDLSNIRPRAVAAPVDVQLQRPATYVPGPDIPGDYILHSSEDPCYENVAALGPEFIGWTLVANEQAGPERSMFLQPDGRSRELNNNPPQASWAPDELSAVFDPADVFPSDNVHLWRYVEGFSKRTLLGGYAPVADIGVWNEQYHCGYEAMVVLPEGEEARPIGRVRLMVPNSEITAGMHVYRDAAGRAFIDRYVNGDAGTFFSTVAGVWNRWNTFFETSMPVVIPDGWLLDSARAGIMLSRCSYRGLEPTYQIGEGAYTKIPARSHALFPVASYEFIWAQQLWNLTGSANEYFQFYLDHYILPDGNLLYNVQDQAEAPLNVGLFLVNSARSYLYDRDLNAFRKRLPMLDKMSAYVLRRYEETKWLYPEDDPHHGLIWGSPEADLGDPHNDYPQSHPLYYQNAAMMWRGLQDHARALTAAALLDTTLSNEATRYTATAAEMRANIKRSLATTLSARNAEMKTARITPFTPEDTHRKPTQLLSYENHRFMQDWFLADWGDAELDEGHLRHRSLAGMQLIGLHIDGNEQRTSNFMEHGTLAVKIRRDDYRSFLLTLYGLVCYTADCGNRYSPEDALIPGGYAGEGNKYWWSAVVNSVLQSTLGLRWLLCYEESDTQVCHLQKAAPKHWFRDGEQIAVKNCPTRFGTIGWITEANANGWRVALTLPQAFAGDVHIHIHPENGRSLQSASVGEVRGPAVILSMALLAGKRSIEVRIT